MRLAVACFPGLGGSGIVGTELGLLLARAGHDVHFVCGERPRRLPEGTPRTWFHPVVAPAHPLASGQYPLALASVLAEVVRREAIDVIHAHYAVPHAVSGWMARDMVGGGVRLVTTLHGTDITELAVDPALRELLRHVVTASDAVSTPSAFLRDAARSALGVSRPIEVIPNFVDPVRWCPGAPADPPVVVHVSNFRAVKRVDRVIEVFRRVAARRRARLVLVGDGPERPAAEASATGYRLDATFTGDLPDAASVVRQASVMLLPSASESFGLAALEASASGVPVVATRVGGLPEVVAHGRTGFLVDGTDDELADAVVAAIDRRAELGAAGRAVAVDRFGAGPVVDAVLRLYGYRPANAATR